MTHLGSHTAPERAELLRELHSTSLPLQTASRTGSFLGKTARIRTRATLASACSGHSEKEPWTVGDFLRETEVQGGLPTGQVPTSGQGAVDREP